MRQETFSMDFSKFISIFDDDKKKEAGAQPSSSRLDKRMTQFLRARKKGGKRLAPD